jgi:hypothetical protein
MYASETWTLTKTEERSLCSFERRIVRCIFRAVPENGEWRRKYNKELRRLFEEPDTVKCIKKSGSAGGDMCAWTPTEQFRKFLTPNYMDQEKLEDLN